MNRIFSFVKLLLPFQAAAWKVSEAPIKQMLNAPEGHEQDLVTSKWRDNTITQLNTLSITVITSLAILLIHTETEFLERFVRRSYCCLVHVASVRSTVILCAIQCSSNMVQRTSPRISLDSSLYPIGGCLDAARKPPGWPL